MTTTTDTTIDPRPIQVEPTFSGCFIMTDISLHRDGLEQSTQPNVVHGTGCRAMSREQIVQLIADLAAALVKSDELWNAHQREAS